MQKIHATSLKVILLLGTLLLVGCASTASRERAYLLEQDYLKMSDVELTAYEQALSDRMATDSTRSGSDVSVGFGIGSWGSHSGIGFGLEQWLGGSGTSPDLSGRRAAVREEMRRRGLLPGP